MLIMCFKCCIKTVILVLSGLNLVTAYAGEITDSEHRTKAATEKLPALICYRCDTMIDGDKCLDVKDKNSTGVQFNCSDDSRICQVKRISITTIGKTGDVTGKPKLWLLQRNCTGTCDPGCIIIGERTKLYSCTTCCEESYCNYGNGADKFRSRLLYLDLIYFYTLSLIFIMKT